jgi:16S rRNA (cytosine1407-C5)-methyltransferase
MKKRVKPVAQPIETSGSPIPERYAKLLPADEMDALLAELERPLSSAVRANPLKVQPQQSLQRWQAAYGWQVKPVPFCPTGWWVTEAAAPVSSTVEYRMGEYYIQDAASMLPVELFDFDDVDAPLVLDMAASPGGKTTHLVSRTADRGLVVGNDSSAGRITALRLVLAGWGAVNTAVTRFPGESFGMWYPATFDRVLLDAPCSMQGLRSLESHPMRPISDGEHIRLAARQSALLASALQTVKVGGQVVYSTCTLAPQEDEGVLDDVLRRFAGVVEVEDLHRKLPGLQPALGADGERTFDPAVQRAARLWPHRYGTAGFFAARLRKTGSVQSENERPPQRDWVKTGLTRLRGKGETALLNWFNDQYGFDLAQVMEGQRLGLWQRQEQVFAIAEAWLEAFAGLPYQALGLPVGEQTPGGFLISHEWAARFARKFTSGRCTLNAEQAAAWLRGQDCMQIPAGDFERGQIVMVFDEQDRCYGRGKVLADRLKNIFPRRLVY